MTMNLTPQLMRIAVLTAACQDIASRDEQQSNPKKAAMKGALTWIDVAKKLGIDLQLSSAFPVVDGIVPPESMLDPVANHLPIRTMTATQGEDLSDADAETIITACGTTVRICDLGFFENLLHHDDAARAKIHAQLLRCGRGAKKLAPVGCEGVTTFIGRDILLDMDQNVAKFEREVIPILKEFKAMGLKLWIEQCPMPGWNTTDHFVNNIAHCAGMWITLIRIAEKHGVADVLYITYDESHDILMGNTHHGSFAAMRAANLAHHVNRFHGKQQYRNVAKTAVWTNLGRMVGLGCRINGQPHPDASKQGRAWGVMTCAHGMIGLGHHNPLSVVLGNEADWLDHQLAARSVLGLNPAETVFILEHEWNDNRVQDLQRVVDMLTISVNYIRGIDLAADSIYRAGEWTKSVGLQLPGWPNPVYDLPGLEEEVASIDPEQHYG
jgi:sugar phosphate isomerase/epimerase